MDSIKLTSMVLGPKSLALRVGSAPPSGRGSNLRDRLAQDSVQIFTLARKISVAGNRKVIHMRDDLRSDIKSPRQGSARSHRHRAKSAHPYTTRAKVIKRSDLRNNRLSRSTESTGADDIATRSKLIKITHKNGRTR